MPPKKKPNNTKSNGNSSATKRQQTLTTQQQKTKTANISDTSIDKAMSHLKMGTEEVSAHELTEMEENVHILEGLNDLDLSEDDVTRIVNGFSDGDLNIAKSLASLRMKEEAAASGIVDGVSMGSFVAKLGEKLLTQDWVTPPSSLNGRWSNGKKSANAAGSNSNNEEIENDTEIKVPTAEEMISFITAIFEDRQEMRKNDAMSASSKQKGATVDVGSNSCPQKVSGTEVMCDTRTGNSVSDKSSTVNSSRKTADSIDKCSEPPSRPMSSINKLIETVPTYTRQIMAKLFTDSTSAKQKQSSKAVASNSNKNSSVKTKHGEIDDRLTFDEVVADSAFDSSEDSNNINSTRRTINVDVSTSRNNGGKFRKSSPSGDSLSSSFAELDDEDLSGSTESSVVTDISDGDPDDNQGMETEHRMTPGGIPQVDLDQMIYMIEKLSNLSLCTVKSICDQWGIGKEVSVATAAVTMGNSEELKDNWVPLFHHALERQQNQQLLRSGQSVRNKQLKTATRKEEQENQLHNLYYRSAIVQQMRWLSAAIVICHADKCNLLKGNEPVDRSKIVDDFVLTLWWRILNLDARTRSRFSDVLGFTEPDPSGEDMCVVVMAAGIAAMLSPLPIPLLQTICSEIGGHYRGSNEPLIDPTLSEGDPDFLHELPVIRLCQELYPRLDEIPVLLNAILHLSVPTVHENGPGSYTCTIDSAMIMTLIPKQTQVTNNFCCMNNSFNHKEKVRWRAQIVVKEGSMVGGEEANRLCFHMWHHSPHTHKIHLSVRSKGATASATNNNKGKKQLINSGTCTNNAVVNAFNANTGSGITLGGTGPLYVSHTFMVEPHAVVGFSNLVPIDVLFNRLHGNNGAPKGNVGANNCLRLYSTHDDRVSFQFNMEIVETIPAKIPILSEADQQKLKRIHVQQEEDCRKGPREIITPVGKGGKKQMAHQEAEETIRDLIAEEQRYLQLAKEQKQKIKEEKRFRALESQTEPKGREKITQQYESTQQNLDIEIKKSWERCLAKKKESDRKILDELERPNESLIAKLSALQQTTHANRTTVTKLSQDKNKVVKDLQKVTSQLELRSKELEQLKYRFDAQSKELEVIEEEIELTRIRIDKKKKIVQQQKEAALHSAHMNAFSTAGPPKSHHQLTSTRPPQPLSHISNNTKGGKKPTTTSQQRVTVGAKGGHTISSTAFQSAQGRGPSPNVMTSASTYYGNNTSAPSSNYDQPLTNSYPVDSKADVDQFWETAKRDPVALASPSSTSLTASSVPGKIQNGIHDSGSFAVVSSGDISSPSSRTASQLFASSSTVGGGLGSFSITSSNTPGGTSNNNNNNAANMIFSSAMGSSHQSPPNSVSPSVKRSVTPLSNNIAHFYHGGSSNAVGCGSTSSSGPSSIYTESNVSYVRDEQQSCTSSTPFSTNPSASSNIPAIHHSSNSTGFLPGGSKYSGLTFSTRAGSNNGINSSNIGNPFSTVGRHQPPPPPPPPLAGSSGSSFYLYGNNGIMKRGPSHVNGSPQLSYGSASLPRGSSHHCPTHSNAGTFYSTGANGYPSHSNMGPGAVGQGNSAIDQGNSGNNINGTSSRAPSFQITANAVNIENMFTSSNGNGSW